MMREMMEQNRKNAENIKVAMEAVKQMADFINASFFVDSR